MRFLVTLENPDQARALSKLLKDRGVDYQLEIKTNTNWGDDQYGQQTYHLWIVDEDAFDQAWDLKEQFLENPDPSAFSVKPKYDKKAIKLIPDPPTIPQGASPITRLTLLICVFLFFLTSFSMTNTVGMRSSLWVPSPVLRWCFYDYPEAAALYTKVMDLWAENGSSALPPEGQILIEKAKNTPYWHGLYDQIVASLRNDKPFIQGPLAEKIREGQLWRIFTPALLHGSLLHILFNMLWLWMLGREVERVLGGGKYLALIAFLAAFSNTCQYLMSGFEFLGYSGVISGFVFFIGQRQKKAPWEGYTLQRSVYIFLVVYILGLAALEGISFILEVSKLPGLPTVIGNTAHLSGALLGYIFGRTSLFAWKG